MQDITATKLLSKTERTVLREVIEGKSNKEVAYALGRSVRTIEDHRSSIMKKLQADNLVELVQKAKSLKPSKRGELEITDLNKLYLSENRLKVSIMGRGIAWLDTGTQESLLQASNYIYTIEKRQGLKISCIEEIAYKMGFINKAQLLLLAEQLNKSTYGQYLLQIANEEIFTFSQ